MAKLYFKYGAMGSSKTAQALIAKFNYEEKGMRVWLIKPSTDTRDGAGVIRSRIGLESAAQVISHEQDIAEAYRASSSSYDAIIADESQFFTPDQIEQLRELVDAEDVPVMCFGLRTDFQTHFFPGSQRLMELADSISEIKTICACGRKATVNARLDAYVNVVTHGAQTLLGGNGSYTSMCHKCWKQKISLLKIDDDDSTTGGSELDALYDKMLLEQTAYAQWLRTQTFETVLRNAYKYASQNDILAAIESDCLSDEDVHLLLSAEKPLETICGKQAEHTGYMDTIFSSIDSVVYELKKNEGAYYDNR